MRAATWVALLWLLHGASAAAQTAGGERYLVMPFENAEREARLFWLSEGSAVLLTDDLLALGASALTREDRLRAFERLHVPPVATLSHATVIRLGRLVGATHVVVGNFTLAEGTLRIGARTLRLDTGQLQPEMVESGPLAELFGVYARIARRIVPSSGVAIEEMEQGHPPLAAFEQYIKGVLAETPATRLAFLEQALKLHPRFERARIVQWQIHTDQGDHRRALDVVRLVPQDHRQSRRARFLGAISLMHLGSWGEAYAVLTELNRASPDAALLNNLGIVRLHRPTANAEAAATFYFTEASKLDPDDPDLFFNLGYAYWQEKNAEAASHWLREAVRRNPADDGAHYALGVVLQAAGRTAEAAREMELAERLSSAWAEREGKPDGGAMPEGLERWKTRLNGPDLLRIESVLVAAEQREHQALAAFHLERGERLYEQERDNEAIAELRRAVYLSPYERAAHLLLGRIYLRTGRVQDAIDALKIAIWSEDTIPARLALAEAFLEARDEEAARGELDVVLKRDPENAEARRLLARLSGA